MIHLHVPSYWSDAVLRYHGETGAYMDAFVPQGAGGLKRPRTLVFRSGGLQAVDVHSYRISNLVVQTIQ